MTSVRNRLPLLSGNRWLIIVVTALVFGACSPKIRPVAPAPPPLPKPVDQPKPAKPVVVKVPSRVSVIAMLLPFGFDHVNSGYTSTGLTQAKIALDYYQGFKVALDSLTALGYNFKLKVFDTKGTAAQARSLANDAPLRACDLIVGPVFPDDMKAFTMAIVGEHKPIVSPLAPSDPVLFKDRNLITVMPPLYSHAWAAAQYVIKTLNPRKIFILKSGFSEDNSYIIPFKNAVDTLGKRRVLINQSTIVRGQLTAIIPQLSLTNPNIFVIPSTNQSFLMVTLHTLDSLADIYPITVIGHPNWQKFAFLNADLLQHLNTYITGADKVNYKASVTVNFTDAYREAYHLEPSDYAIKGFDEGIYFGGLMGAGHGQLKDLDKSPFTGLHNNFVFVHKVGLGWINTHVNIYHYINFDLKRVE